jgi:hypothetical protein
MSGLYYNNIKNYATKEEDEIRNIQERDNTLSGANV